MPTPPNVPHRARNFVCAAICGSLGLLALGALVPDVNGRGVSVPALWAAAFFVLFSCAALAFFHLANGVSRARIIGEVLLVGAVLSFLAFGLAL